MVAGHAEVADEIPEKLNQQAALRMARILMARILTSSLAKALVRESGGGDDHRGFWGRKERVLLCHPRSASVAAESP